MRDCKDCVYHNISEKFFYCKECSTCTNGENEDTNNNFKPKDILSLQQLEGSEE